MTEKQPFNPDITNPDIRIPEEETVPEIVGEHPLEALVDVKQQMRGVEATVQEVDKELKNVEAEYGGLVLGNLHFNELSLEGTEISTGNRLVIPFKDLDVVKLRARPNE